jgi:hypothetical protein
MEFYVIYRHPRDHPRDYVVRRWSLDRGYPLPTADYQLATNLPAARSLLPPGLLRFDRDSADDQCVVESWF